MKDLINDISLGFFLLALVSLALIFRDAFRHLNADDQTTFRRWMGQKLSLRTRAIDSVWKEHARGFPNSRKRLLFVFFLTASVVVGVGHQLWRIVGYREVDQHKNVAGQVASSQFRVNVELSEGARDKLNDSKETIIVAGYFTGHPKEGTEARYLDIKSGDVPLGNAQQEIRPGETAVFTQINLNSDAMSRIDSQGPQILINVFSGRRSSNDNLLSCNLYEGGLDSLRGKTIVIRCHLIAEPFHRQSTSAGQPPISRITGKGTSSPLP
jgi:hypothetical protein